MKKILLLIVVFLFLLAGCSNNEVSTTSPAQNNSDETQAVEASGDASISDASIGDASFTEDSGISSSEGVSEEIIEIKEKLFVAQINDIYLNAEDYLGKTIKYEGIFNSFEDTRTNTTYCYVIRYGPGCCGNDANVGFEVEWKGEYPQQNDWVEVVGVVERCGREGNQYLLWLRLSSLMVLPTRGAEDVYY